MRIATVDECKRIDRLAQEAYDLTEDVLMEAAGALAAREIEQSFFTEVLGGDIAVICGPGNNGADGLVVARHLAGVIGRRISVYTVNENHKQTSDGFNRELKRAQKAGVEVSRWHDKALLGSNNRNPASLIVDAIFGIGLRAESKITGHFKDVIESLNSAHAPIVSLDTPSGLDSDRGLDCGVAVRATMTITFGLAKRGFFISDGPSRVGRLRILPIGYPVTLVRKVAKTQVAVGGLLAKKLLPNKKQSANKSSNGHAAIFAGKAQQVGAALLASLTASRVGAGYVTLASFDQSVLDQASRQPELLTSLADHAGFWKDRKWKVAAVGPGLGVTDKTEKLIKRLIDEKIEQVVLDADALTVLSKSKIEKLPSGWVLTPHAGEMSRLLGGKHSAKEIESDRFRFAQMAAEKYGCTVLLKGFRTVIASGGRCYVVLSGNAALAKAGTGDVLTGAIAGLMAQDLETAEAAVLAAFLHGKIGDEWLRTGRDIVSLVATDVSETLPYLIRRLRDGAES